MYDFIFSSSSLRRFLRIILVIRDEYGVFFFFRFFVCRITVYTYHHHDVYLYVIHERKKTDMKNKIKCKTICLRMEHVLCCLVLHEKHVCITCGMWCFSSSFWFSVYLFFIYSSIHFGLQFKRSCEVRIKASIRFWFRWFTHFSMWIYFTGFALEQGV